MTYEYICTACKYEWEAEQSITAAALKTCPSCNEQTAQRQVSGGTGFVLKGGGWYADGYGSTRPSAGKSESTSSASGSSSSASSESSSSASSESSKLKDKPKAKPTSTAD